jgi:hypothetical protein
MNNGSPNGGLRVMVRTKVDIAISEMFGTSPSNVSKLWVRLLDPVVVSRFAQLAVLSDDRDKGVIDGVQINLEHELLNPSVERVVISRTKIEIELGEGRAKDDHNRILIIPWTPPSPYRRREIIQGESEQSPAMRPMKTKARAVLVDALRDAHRWLDELMTNSNQTTDTLAAREGKTERSIRMTLSLAFLSPALGQAAIDGRLPRGFGVKRMMDLPMAWSDQWSTLGLKAPAQSL